MTTLPQTMNVRLPRPAPGAMQLAGGGGALAAPAAAQAAGGNEFWRIIRAHWVMILVVVIVLAPGAGFGVFKLLDRYYPRYTATGFIQVQPQLTTKSIRSADSETPDTANIAVDIRTQARLLKSEALLLRVLQNEASKIRETDWFKQYDGNIGDALLSFDKSLVVIPIQDTKLVQIDFSYSSKKDCKTIVVELVNAHLEDQKERQNGVLSDRTTMLNNVKLKSESRLKDIEADMREKQTQVNEGGGGIGFMSLKEMELNKLVQERLEAGLILENKRAAFRGAKEAADNGLEVAGVERVTFQLNPQLINDRAQLRQMEMELEIMKSTRGPEATQVKQFEQRVMKMRTNYQQDLDEARARARTMILEEMAQDLQAAETKAEGLRLRVESLRSDIAGLANVTLQYLNLKDEHRALRETVKQIKDQIENVLALQSSAQSYRVSWMSQPEEPQNPSFPKLGMVMGVAIGLGLVLSLGMAYLIETMDQSIRSPRDIAKVGQLQLLGIIPDEADDPQAIGARLPAVIFDAPHSAMAESFRQVRTKLQHAASLDTTRSIMVTSPSPGDGKTTVACNIATGLALNGRRILLVDANFRRPEVHRVFGLNNEQGFSDVLNAVAAFDEVIHETQVPNLAVMTAGPKPMNPTELFESQLLIDFIERALEEFDHVVFDSGPLMVVAEAQAMAPRVDGVISVVRAKTNNRGMLQRMRDELKRTKAEHLGIVLNAVRAQGGGYYRRSIQTYYDYAGNGQS